MLNTSRIAVLPEPGGPLVVAYKDVVDAIARAPVWLHAGIIDVVWRFRRTWLGPFWHTLGIAAFILGMGVVWGTILRADMTTYFRYLSASLIVWTLIASVITEGTGTIIGGQTTALSMRFPYIAFAFAHVWRILLVFAHHFVLYILVMVFTMTAPGWVVLQAIPGMALLILNCVWITLAVGVLCLKRRDFIPAFMSGMQIMMVITPVFWGKELLGASLAWASDFNPFFHLLRVVRDPLIGQSVPMVSWIWVSAMLAVGGFTTLWLYGRYRDRFAYWY